MIGRAGAGVDNIDVAAATERGVLVMNTPGANAQAAAELTVGLMFAVARRIAAADASVKAGRWERSRFRGTQLLGKTLGIVGIGNVGRLVARSAVALGMHVIAHDPYVTPELAAEHGVVLVSFDALLEEADYISVHTPLTAGSRGSDRRRRDRAHEAGRVPDQLLPRRGDRRSGVARRRWSRVG